MAKGYFSHFLAILLIHFVALSVTIELSRPEMSETLANLKLSLSNIQNELPKVSKARTLEPRKKVVSRAEPTATGQIQSKNVLNEQETKNVLNSGMGNSSILESYKAELRAMIDKNKYYPAMSKRLGQTGTVVVAFTLLEDGNIIDVRIDRPSRFDRLNASALDAVMKVERFKPLPKEFGESKMDVKVPVTFVTI